MAGLLPNGTIEPAGSLQSEMHAPIETTGIRRLIKSVFHGFGYDVVKLGRSKLTKPIDENYVEILDDPAFQASVKEVRGITLLDTARLANLWMLCRASNPLGSAIEIGSYRGGGALHISNWGAFPLFPGQGLMIHRDWFAWANSHR
jgi:hypothetical protein